MAARDANLEGVTIMFLCSATPAYGFEKQLKALEPHRYIQWRHRAVSLNTAIGYPAAPFPTSQAELKDHHSVGDLLMDSDEAEAWAEIGIELTIKRFKGINSNSNRLPEVVYQISIANVGLMQVQCVEVLEDCCTDEVQRWLDKGWRMIAVCPPNDTRRPSYVMGHTEKEPHR